MSPASENPVGRPPRIRLGFLPYFAVSMVVVAIILGLAMGSTWADIMRLAERARPHAPDLALLASLSTPIKIHLATALAALVLGAVLMVVRKGRTFHRTAGWVWVSLVSVTAGATLFITSLTPGSWSFIHLFTGWTLIALPLAVIAAKRHKVVHHRRTMMGLFYGAFAINLVIAFIPGRTMWQMFFG
jgi:uncharacterized membrane protein